MRTRKTSLIKHKKKQLEFKKNKKRLVIAGVESEIAKYASAMYRIARMLQFKVKSLETRLVNLNSDKIISDTRLDVLTAMMIYMLIRIQDETSSVMINKAELNDIIKQVQNNELLIDSKDDKENYYIRAVLKEVLENEEDNKDDNKQSEEKESE